jgi:hypothetical protein
VVLLFFDWYALVPITLSLWGVFRILPLARVRRCLSRMKVSRKSSFKKIIGNNEEMLLAA